MTNDLITLSFEDNLAESVQGDWQVAFNLTESILKETEVRNDPHYALDAIRILTRMSNTSALAKARILYFLKKNWAKYEINEDFYVLTVHYGLKNKQLIQRYIDVWALFEDKIIPEPFVEKMKEKSINNLVPIMGALKLGYEISNEHWAELAEIQGHLDTAEYLRSKVKNSQPERKTILFRIQGEFLVAINDNKKYKIAKLNLDSEDEIVRVALSRLLKKLGALPDDF